MAANDALRPDGCGAASVGPAPGAAYCAAFAASLPAFRRHVRPILLLSVGLTIASALAVGVTFAFLQVNILPAVCFIGATTFVLSCSGIKIGHVFGLKYKSRAEFFGGAVLILMGIKILLEHLGILG